MDQATRGPADAYDLTGIVDGVGRAVITAQRAEVGHDALRPEKRVLLPIGSAASSDHLAGRVDSTRDAWTFLREACPGPSPYRRRFLLLRAPGSLHWLAP